MGIPDRVIPRLVDRLLKATCDNYSALVHDSSGWYYPAEHINVWSICMYHCMRPCITDPKIYEDYSASKRKRIK